VLVNWIYNKLGSDFCGTPCPPGDNESIFWRASDWKPTVSPLKEKDGYYLAQIGNGGFELYLGSGDNWNLFMPLQAARRMARWLFWVWVKWEWCGLRRWLWYWALHRICKRNALE